MDEPSSSEATLKQHKEMFEQELMNELAQIIDFSSRNHNNHNHNGHNNGHDELSKMMASTTKK